MKPWKVVFEALVVTFLLCGLLLMPAANIAADDSGQVTGETVVIEPAGTGTWQAWTCV